MKPQDAMIMANGNADVGLLSPIMAAANAPKAIWIAPIKAEAVPAFFVKGAMESADEFGKANPWQLRNREMSTIVLYKFNQLKAVPANNNIPTNVCTLKVTSVIC